MSGLGRTRNRCVGLPIHNGMSTWDERFGSDPSTHSQRRIPEDLNDLCFRIVGAAIEVHRALGPGFLEATYEEAMAIELGLRQLPFERQVPMPILYKGRVVNEHRLDMIIDCRVVLELKAIASLEAVHAAQVLAYLKAAGHQVGLLINFNVPILKNGIRRLLWDL